MERIGEYLQRAREQRGISLDAVASQTRVSLKMLKAIERNDFSQMPSEVSARGFVIAYGRCLGISEDEIQKRFRESASPYYVRIAQAHPQPEPGARGRAREWISPILTGVILAGMAILVGVAFYERSLESSAVPGDPLGVAPLPDALHPESLAPPLEIVPDLSPDALKQPSDSVVDFKAGAVPVTTPPNRGQVAADDLLLVIEAVEQSWVLAEIDEETVKEVLLRPGEAIRWRAKEKIVLTVGNAGGIVLELNGQALEPLGPTGKVIRDIVLTK